MAQVTIHKAPGVIVDVIDGFPPADQSALVAEQVAQIAALNAQVVALKAEKDAAVQSAESANEEAALALADLGALTLKVAAFNTALEGLTA